MNKGQGFAMGMVLAAALLLRPSGSPTQSPSSATTDTTAPAAQMLEARDGPWVASCNYWAPARQAPDDTPAAADIRGKIGTNVVDLRTSFGDKDRKSELACSGPTPFDRWGFPQDTSHVDVTALIAITHNPVHTHMALSFDRSIDAILQAATDNGYVSSAYWLPWRSRGEVSKLSDLQFDLEPRHDPQREREPGLIVLRQATNYAGFNKVVFLFVVGETTTQGVDGAQLQRAFKYEAELKASLQGSFHTGKMQDSGERIAIIGPNSSASAVPLVAAISTLPSNGQWKPREVEIAGDTGTSAAVAQFRNTPTLPVHYHSFGYDGDYSREAFENSLCQSGYSLNRMALLVEANSFYSSAVSSSVAKYEQEREHESERYNRACGSPLTIKFPREISLLRNTEGDSAAFTVAPPAAAVSPYLRFSVKDRSIQDGIPLFSRESSPLSQEAQLMMISRELQRSRVQFVAIGATNPLDTIFLAQFLHRAVPEATLVFWNADLLTVRDMDSVPFVGSLSVSPYLMVGLGASQARSGGQAVGTFPSSSGYAFYNAASYTFWHNGLVPSRTLPLLSRYGNPLRPGTPGLDVQAPPLWVSAIGRDGYYPLGILRPCSSQSAGTLPSIHEGNAESQFVDPVIQQEDACAASIPEFPRTSNLFFYPGRLWFAICILILALCLLQSLLLLIADYHSPITRDLAVTQNDQHGRRSIYIRAASATLLALAWAAANPVLTLHQAVVMSPLSLQMSYAVLAAGLCSLAVGAVKTRVYIHWQGADFRCAWKERFTARCAHAAYEGLLRNYYFFVNLFVAVALGAYVLVWDYLCSAGTRTGSLDLRGLAFDFRCLNPGSGISPLPPVVILMFGWYLWSFLQARRLRFSPDSRPILPFELTGGEGRFAYVPDEAMSKRNSERPPRLYDYITRLMTVRQLLHHFPCPPGHDWLWRDFILTFSSAAVFVCLILWTPIRAVDHFLWPGRNASLYEILFASLLYPLVALCVSGSLRMFLIWHTLKRDLLDRLEDLPLRFAFSRLKGLNWMTMLRRGGPHQQNRDIARSVESMNQLVRIFHVQERPERHALQAASDSVAAENFQLQSSAVGDPAQPAPRDLDYRRMHRVEEGLAEFSRELLAAVLIPYWSAHHVDFVQSKEIDLPHPESPTPLPIQLAEEFLAIRYVSAIGAVLGNLRDLMFFVSISFVLAFLAWNSGTFQPRLRFDWIFTVLLAVLGCVVISVFAQMHRNTILSRITDTRANELGWDFYFRVASFGALPVLTWLAYQLPDLGSLIFRFVEPSVPVVK